MCPAVQSQRLPHFLVPLDDAVYNISAELTKRFAMKSSQRALRADPRQQEEKEENVKCVS